MSGTGTSGQIDIFSSGSTHVLADLAGYFRPFP